MLRKIYLYIQCLLERVEAPAQKPVGNNPSAANYTAYFKFFNGHSQIINQRIYHRVLERRKDSNLLFFGQSALASQAVAHIDGFGLDPAETELADGLHAEHPFIDRVFAIESIDKRPGRKPQALEAAYFIQGLTTGIVPGLD